MWPSDRSIAAFHVGESSCLGQIYANCSLQPSPSSLLGHCEDSAIAPIFLSGKTKTCTHLATSSSKVLANSPAKFWYCLFLIFGWMENVTLRALVGRWLSHYALAGQV